MPASDLRLRLPDALLALALAGGQSAQTAASADSSGSAAAVAAVSGFVLVLAWRRRYPIAVMCAFVVGATLQDLLITGQADTAFSFAGYLIASYSVGRHAGGRVAVAGLAVGLLGSVEELLRYWPKFSGSEFVFSAVVIAGSWLAGRSLREHQRMLATSEERVTELARLREQESRAAIRAERTRIARELHDAVAHGVSVMVIQAGAAEEILDRDPDRARQALHAVQDLGREAVGELRSLLGILRDDDERATLAPQPKLSQLSALVAQVRDAGLPVEVVIDGSPRVLPRGIDLCAYRIVQEGLTNALRHSGNATCRVALGYEEAALSIEISDEGRGPARPSDGSGHGIIGMRERVALYGGDLQVGPTGGTGFAVRARLPVA